MIGVAVDRPVDSGSPLVDVATRLAEAAGTLRTSVAPGTDDQRRVRDLSPAIEARRR
jgi:hypothetical protein